jgi:hypothetical protein
MAQADAQIIQFPAKRRREKAMSQCELYPLPFFNGKTCCTWDVKPTGNYVSDCETGRRYAIEFLRTADGSYGWSLLLSDIVGDMIRAGPTGTYANGEPKVNGIVIGFMSTINRLVNAVAANCKDTIEVLGRN